jgi:N6-L-threonylcarbamoyladenine synthase
MIILGIETSCDETAISLLSAKGNDLVVLSSVVSSQVKLHAKWGGVVPNLAAREHLRNIIPVLRLSLTKAKIKPRSIDLISVTEGPGLIPALLIGVNAAKTLSYIWRRPLLGIHHIEGHIYANFIFDEISVSSKFKVQSSKFPLPPTPSPIGRGWPERQGEGKIKFPILCLVVSGGHTQLVLMKKHLDYKIIGQTLDDAAGEAFDKVARILGLGYPGGPTIAKAAMQHYKKINKSLSHVSCLMSHKISLPRPMINSNNFNFSFSGLKTAVLYETRKHPKLLKDKKYIAALCHEFQQAAIDVLVAKTIKAAQKYHPKTIMLAGGVSANKELRKQLREAVKKELKNIYPVKSAKGGAKQFNGAGYQIPATKYSIDNAAMIASAAYFRWKKMNNNQRKRAFQNWKALEADANLKLK